MPTAENKNICRRFFDEVVSQGDLSLVDEICAPDYRLHATPPGTRLGGSAPHRLPA